RRLDCIGERAGVGRGRVARLRRIEVAATLVNDTLRIGDQYVLLRQPELDEQIEARDRRRAGARTDQLDLRQLLSDDLQAVQNGRRRDDRGAVLVVVEDG